MPTIWDPAARAELLSRLDMLSPDAKPKWGQMNAVQLVVHLAAPMRAALGEIKTTPKPSPLGIWPLNKLVIHWLPWPKGAPTAPEFIPPKTGDWERSRVELKAALERFVAAGPDGKLAPHVAFGELSGKDWGALTHRHWDHHLRQFGV